jgi:hypothetical protein
VCVLRERDRERKRKFFSSLIYSPSIFIDIKCLSRAINLSVLEVERVKNCEILLFSLRLRFGIMAK